MGIISRVMDSLAERRLRAQGYRMPGETDTESSERGYRTRLMDRVNRLYAEMAVNLEIRHTIQEVRLMDKKDPRVRRIHTRTARSAVKGGLIMETGAGNDALKKRWADFVKRLGLDQRAKLESDFRGLMMEGNLPLQMVVSESGGPPRVIGAVRMPSETIVPRTGKDGRITEPAAAYEQIDWPDNKVIASFALWQLKMVRLAPDNYDDWGCLGRPYIDAGRTLWKQLTMTESDLVIRRRTRAPQRMHHNLAGASREELTEYQKDIEQDQSEGNWKDYYTNKKDAAVTAVGGDANLDQVRDIILLLDAFHTSAPAPKGLFGYVDDIPRDILEDLKRDMAEEMESMQELVAEAYQKAFELDLLLSGINPLAIEFQILFKEPHAMTMNQRADLALKRQAVGASRDTVWRTAGLDPDREQANREKEADEFDPYPDNVAGPGTGQPPRVSITPGNERKGDSGTSIAN